MKCPKCDFDNPNEMQFCGKCGSKLTKACPKCGSINPPEFQFCGKCGTKINDTTTVINIPKLEDMHAQLQSMIPESLAQKYLSAEQQYTGENRPITALFADISGFTPLSATKSSETIFQLVQDSFKQLVSIVAKYEGSISGFRFLVDRYRASMFALAYSKLCNFEDAEDVTQDAFILAYKNLRKLKQYDSFHAWLYSITSNLCKKSKAPA